MEAPAPAENLGDDLYVLARLQDFPLAICSPKSSAQAHRGTEAKAEPGRNKTKQKRVLAAETMLLEA